MKETEPARLHHSRDKEGKRDVLIGNLEATQQSEAMTEQELASKGTIQSGQSIKANVQLTLGSAAGKSGIGLMVYVKSLTAPERLA